MTDGSGASDDRIPISLQIGQVIGDKFRIERVLGEGGMGVVVAATHLQLDEAVALKFLRGHSHSDPESLARFMREARAAAKLKSEHVARVLDVDVTDDGLPYIVMEFLEGQDLARTLKAEGLLPVETAAEYAIQACEGLAEAHARGIVHRDIKPENLFLVDRAQGWRLVKILDFGVSKFAVSRDVANVSTRNMMGSPCYMSPEQLLSSATVDHRTDLWSLGATLFELVSGRTAYDTRPALPVIVGTILGRDPPRLEDALPGVSSDLAAIVARCLTKDVHRRFANAAELAVALLPFAPKRARLAVERAVAVTQSSVISSRERPPLPLVSAAPAGPSGAAAPIVPTLPSGGAPLADAGKGASTLGHLATVAPAPQSVRARRPAVWTIRGAVVIAAAALAWLLGIGRPAPRTASPATPNASIAVQPATGITEAAVTAPPPANAPPPPAALMSVSPPTAASVRAAPEPARPVRATKAVARDAQASQPDLDIRLER